MNVITVSGKAEAGKDTFALILKDILEKEDKKVLIFHYADLLKFYCKQYFGWNGQKDIVGRTLLQKVGTDIVRSKDEDFWVNRACDFLNMFGDEFDYVLICDTRFENEVNIMKDIFNSVSVFIKRINYTSSLTEEQRNHKSENILSERDCDYFIVNDDMDNFINDVKTFKRYYTEDITVKN